MHSKDPKAHDAFESLTRTLGRGFPEIEKARKRSTATLSKLQSVCKRIPIPEGLAVVAFGSLARREWTSGSDVDWTLLIDAPTAPEHFQIAQAIAQELEAERLTKPGSTGIFGGMASSHELIHHIGGQEDTNGNLTRRLLLLLESRALTDSSPLENVIRQILRRYIACDPGVSSLDHGHLRVPRFLLNDVIRYWRTVAVDYATKKWKHGTSGWALRNIKLRMSRKLLFTKGLLACFDCGLHPHEPNMPKNPSPDIVAVCLQERVYSLCRMTPIDILCQSLSKHSTPDISTKILSAYNAFLHTLDNQQSRKALEDLGPETAHKDTVFEQMRSTSHEFGDQLEHFFFDGDPQLRTITKKYGVF